MAVWQAHNDPWEWFDPETGRENVVLPSKTPMKRPLPAKRPGDWLRKGLEEHPEWRPHVQHIVLLAAGWQDRHPEQGPTDLLKIMKAAGCPSGRIAQIPLSAEAALAKALEE